MIKNVGLMAVSTLLRLLTGVLLFVLMARVWGVERFGEFVYPFTVAALMSIVVDYGFSLQVVRDVGVAPGNTAAVVREAIGAKALLALSVCIPSLVYVVWFGGVHRSAILFFSLLVAAILNSFALLLNLPFRSLNQFGQETRVVVVANLIHLVLVVAALLAGASVAAVALVFVVSRLTYLVLSIAAYARIGGPHLFSGIDYRTAYAAVRRGLPFGLFVALGTAYFQVDTVLIQWFLGTDAVGLYHAGVRLLLAALLLPEILSNVYLPAMAANGDRFAEAARLGIRLTRHLLMFGAFGLAVLVMSPGPLVRAVYGEGYEGLAPLLPSFGVVLLLRFGASALGLLLTASGRQTARTLVVAGALIVSVGANLVLIPRFGLAGAVNAAIATHVVLFAGYVWIIARQRRSNPLDRRSWALIALAVAIAVAGPQDGPNVALLAVGTLAGAVALGVSRDEWRRVLARVVRP